MENKDISLLKKGLLFVALAYITIKCIDQYELIFNHLTNFVSLTWPFILGAIFAYSINPLSSFFEKKLNGKRGLSILISYFIIFSVLGIGLSLIIPVVYQNITDLITQIPYYIDKLQIFYQNSAESIGVNLGLAEDLSALGIKFLPYLGDILTNSVNVLINATTNTINVTFNIFIAMFISFYMLLDKENFCSYTKKITYVVFRKNVGDFLIEATHVFNSNIGKYLVGKSIDSIFVGICAIIGLAVIKAQYAVLLGVIFGITNMIPYIGPIIGITIAVGINLFNSPIISIIVLIYLLIIQQIESLIIDPKVVGKQLGLNPVFTLLAVSLGGKYFGIPGVVLGAPVAGVFKMYFSKFINSKYSQIYKEESR